MKIVVMADTHIPESAVSLPKKLLEALKDCQLIIHAGDIVEMSLFKELQSFAEVKAVFGNMDSIELQQMLPEKVMFKAAGKNIGLYHGRGPGLKVYKIVREVFKEKPDIIIFGHSHTPFNQVKDGVLLFNPGSPTDNIFSPYRSFGLIEIDGEDLKAEIIKLGDDD